MLMKNIASVPPARPGIPCASRPIYFTYAFSYSVQYFGFFITCLYSIISPVSWFSTAFIISEGYLCCASFRGDMGSCMTLAQFSIASCPMECVRLLVRCAGPSFCVAALSRRISSMNARFAAGSASLGERRGGCTLGGVAVGRSDPN